MPNFCLSKAHFSSLLITDFISYGSFIFSHPLYFSYFVFFSPYLLKLVSFLSPLFVTTFLLFISLLTLLPSFHSNFSTEVTYGHHEEFQCMENLEVYEIVFGGIPVDFFEVKSEVNSSDVVKHEDPSSICKSEASTGDIEEKSVHMEKLENSWAKELKEKRLENFLTLLDKFEAMTCNVNGKKVEPTRGTKPDEIVKNEKEELLAGNGSGAINNKVCSNTIHGREYTAKVKDIEYTDNGGEHTLIVKSSPTLSGQKLRTYGSMRKEKEWKRTLACKLFEERHNTDGGEGMDSLWETYEMDSEKSKPKTDAKRKVNNTNKNKKGEIKVHLGNDEEEEISGQLCCLQALKFSTGKMTLGIGRPNVVKNISKAIKGIGWLHNVSRQAKKVHHNGDRY